MAKKKQYTVSDGKLVLTFKPQPEGGYVISSPLDPELLTEGETIEEGFDNARDAAEVLQACRDERRKTVRSGRDK